MLQHVLHVSKMNDGFAKRLVNDLTDDQMVQQPHGLVNHPTWSLGHLAVAAHDVCNMLGVEASMPAGWKDTFKTGGTPTADKAAFPTKDELLSVLGQLHERVAQGLSSIDPAELAKPHPNEKTRTYFPTVGDLVVFLATAHEMDHLGQIAAWRRAMGLAPA